MAAPSPRINPRRSREKGRHVSGETTRMASHAFRSPMENGASLPPAIAISADPLRTIQNAWPIAWLADEHAVDTVYTGPVIPYSREMRLRPGFAIALGIRRG